MWEQEKNTSAHKHIHFDMTCNGEGGGGMEVSQWLGALYPASWGIELSQPDKQPSGPAAIFTALSQTRLSHWGNEAVEGVGWGVWGVHIRE